jgi:hypothetical protein
MARARTIKPALFKNEVLAELDPLARLLFIGLWTLADREGRLEDRPLRIKAELFPYATSCDVDTYLSNLCAAGFVIRYTVAGANYLEIKNFVKHQRPHPKEAASDLPAPEEAMEFPGNATANSGMTGANPPSPSLVSSLQSHPPMSSFNDSVRKGGPKKYREGADAFNVGLK